MQRSISETRSPPRCVRMRAGSRGWCKDDPKILPIIQGASLTDWRYKTSFLCPVMSLQLQRLMSFHRRLLEMSAVIKI